MKNLSVKSSVNYIVNNEGNLVTRYMFVALNATTNELTKAIEAVDTAIDKRVVSAGYAKRVKGFFSNLKKSDDTIRVDYFKELQEAINNGKKVTIENIRNVATAVNELSKKEPTKKTLEFTSNKESEEDVKKEVMNNVLNLKKSAFYTPKEGNNDPKGNGVGGGSGAKGYKLADLKALPLTDIEIIRGVMMDFISKASRTDILNMFNQTGLNLDDILAQSKEVA